MVQCPPMRRLARWLFTLCSAASLVLCVAACVLWVRSYSVADRVDWANDAGSGYVLARSGLLMYFDYRPHEAPEHPRSRA